MFQSTPSAREGDKDHSDMLPVWTVSIHAFREGRRRDVHRPGEVVDCFNPRLPRGKATIYHVGYAVTYTVSIHAFREGRRQYSSSPIHVVSLFQSTPSAREGDESREVGGRVGGVSIHAFREGRRRTSTRILDTSSRFNPRLPRGKATRQNVLMSSRVTFQSTPSAREGDVPAIIVADVA